MDNSQHIHSPARTPCFHFHFRSSSSSSFFPRYLIHWWHRVSFRYRSTSLGHLSGSRLVSLPVCRSSFVSSLAMHLLSSISFIVLVHNVSHSLRLSNTTEYLFTIQEWMLEKTKQRKISRVKEKASKQQQQHRLNTNEQTDFIVGKLKFLTNNNKKILSG